MSFSFSAKSQIELSANQTIPNLYSPDVKIDSTNNLNDFPESIQTKSRLVLKRYTGEFYDSISFLKGQIIDFGNLMKSNFFTDTNSIFNYYNIDFRIPKYELYFKLTDQSINIKQIIIKLTFDEFGQIIEFQWPCNTLQKEDFLNTEQVMTKLKEKTNDFNIKKPDSINLKYDKKINNFVWSFSLIEHSTNNNFGSGIVEKKYSVAAFSEN